MQTGAAMLSLTRVVHDAEGRGAEHLHALYRPNRFSFQMNLLRTGAQDHRRWSPLPARAKGPPGPADAASARRRPPRPHRSAP